MDDKALLELCLSISGAFEGGTPHYTDLTGNFDGQGLSAGILQWAAGQNSLQSLLVTNIAPKMGWDKMQSFFHSDIHHFAMLKGQDAIQWCLDHYIQTGTTNVDPAAQACWVAMLGQPESVAGQVEAASNWQMARGKVLAAQFCPDTPVSTRCIAFFFDLVTQSGGMANKQGHVDPLPAGQDVDVSDVLAYAQTQNAACAAIWTAACQIDPLARRLLYYAYKRSLLSKPQYQWDACSRRGSIGCRGGVVHKAKVDFTLLLD